MWWLEWEHLALLSERGLDLAQWGPAAGGDDQLRGLIGEDPGMTGQGEDLTIDRAPEK
jgi:hypothetical protein